MQPTIQCHLLLVHTYIAVYTSTAAYYTITTIYRIKQDCSCWLQTFVKKLLLSLLPLLVRLTLTLTFLIP